ncbi:ShlB/FhaC/HecB family hemolysin secretion/activation protein, partial [Bartonella sp. 220]|nr:ShlB/FhaC/HecB family hemolysin secretion/activation protein [Bartonella sp. 220B]
MRCSLFSFVLTTAFLCLFSLPSLAETIREKAINQSEGIQRQQTQEQRFQQLHRRNKTQGISLPDDDATALHDGSRSKTCLMVKSIALMGARLISYRDLHGSISRWEGHCLG